MANQKTLFLLLNVLLVSAAVATMAMDMPFLEASATIGAPTGTKSTGKGKGMVDLFANGTACVTLNLTGSLNQITMAHIHVKNASAGNPIYTWLLPVPASGAAPAMLNPFLTYKGAFSFVSTVTISNIARFQALLKGGLLYINVHTVKVPSGEVQGFLVCKKGCKK